jgi:hypothetical protein
LFAISCLSVTAQPPTPRQRRPEFSRGFQPTVPQDFFRVASATIEFSR